jgi:hypothetical protein
VFTKWLRGLVETNRCISIFPSLGGIKITLRVYSKNNWMRLLYDRNALDRFTICRKLEEFSAKPARPHWG